MPEIAETTELQKIAAQTAERGFAEGWSKSEWSSAIQKEIGRFYDEIREVRACDKCDLCEDHHA